MGFYDDVLAEMQVMCDILGIGKLSFETEKKVKVLLILDDFKDEYEQDIANKLSRLTYEMREEINLIKKG